MIPQLALRTQTAVTPQMVLASHLLELPVSELEILLQREVANNPALQLDVADDPTWPHETLAPLASWKDSDASLGEDFRDEADTRAWQASAREQLAAQARMLVTAEDLAVAIHIIYALDVHGFLREANEALASELGVTAAQIERVVSVLHELEPPGIGARNIQECFLLQCAALAAEGVNCDLVRRILHESWDDFLTQRWPRVAATLDVHPSAVEAARSFMCRNLYPYPLLLVDEPTTDTVTFRHADVIVRPNPDSATAAQCQYVIEVPAAERYHLSVRRDFEQMLATNTGKGKALPPEQQAWVGQSIAHAQSIISAVNQRWATLHRIAAYVVGQQADFFTFGPGHLKPLPRVAVAQALDMHESTVSRAVRDKIMQRPNGRLFAMSDLFDGSRSVKEALRCVLEQAESPLSDRELALRLQAQGWTLARRTVAKYREELGMLPRNRRHTIRKR